MLNATLPTTEGRSAVFRAPDGVRLHARVWDPPGASGRIPVVCLSGLTRSSDDFVPLASTLAVGPAPRRVVAPDYRGRGRSDHDPDGRYDLATERADLLLVLDALGLDRVHFVGTSRGGLHVMMLAAAHRARIAAVVLNDVGPVLEADGLVRIKSYIGRQTRPANLGEAVRMMKLGSAAAGFDGLDEQQWRHFAQTTFGSDENDLKLRYDLRLARALDELDLSQPLPDLWSAFDGLRPAPVLTIRGANSDLLSPDTLQAMSSRWSGNRALVVPGQAHAPLLSDAGTIGAIAGFLDDADRDPSPGPSGESPPRGDA